MSPSTMPKGSPTAIPPNDRKASAIAFLERALAWFGRYGVTVERMMADNGSAYRSHAFRRASAGARLRHLRTPGYMPRTNGKAERFIQTALREWAYATTTIPTTASTPPPQPHG
jgi:transposase InsO family protein